MPAQSSHPTQSFLPATTDFAEQTELRLLLLCARIRPTAAERDEIRQLLDGEVDWTRFVAKSVDHGLTSLVGHTLAEIAPDLLPDELRNGFVQFRAATGRGNRARLEALTGLLAGLEQAGVAAIPIKGPFLALRIYGDISLRPFADLDFLIRQSDLPRTLTALAALGYPRKPTLTETQLDLIHDFQGQEIIHGTHNGVCLEPHTRLTSRRLALDIDHDALWRRATRRDVAGHSVVLLAPEDEVIALAIHGGKELWWSLKWGADIAAFLATTPELNWPDVFSRAQQQGCLRMLTLALAIAIAHFGALLPNDIAARVKADRTAADLSARLMARWASDVASEDSHTQALSGELLSLHDRLTQRMRYVWQSLLLPGPSYIASYPLPRQLSFAYIPLKLVHDVAALPLYRLWQSALRLAGR